jgi:hypothetical protein
VLLLLDPSSKGALNLTSSGGVLVTGGGVVVIDSSNSQAAVDTGKGNVVATEFDFTGNPGYVATGSGTFQGVIHSGVAPMADPLASLPVPTAPTTTFAAVNYTGSAPLTLSPGTYKGGIKNAGTGTITLLPGLYYLKGGGLAITGSGGITGNGVMIYNAPASTSDQIKITGSGSLNLTPQTSGTYVGISIFQDRNSTASIDLTAGGGMNITGTIYAAKAKVNRSGGGGITGQADSKNKIGSQFILYDLNMTGPGSFQADATYNLPLTVTENVTPAPVQLPDGSLVTNVAQSTVQGTAKPGVPVQLETGGDGLFDEGSLNADGSGNYSFGVTLAPGANVLQVRAEDQFGSVVTTSTTVSLDTQPPVVTIASPVPGSLTNHNATVAGRVTDNLSGVASLQAQVDSGSFANVSFDASGNYSFATSLATDGSADGTHTINLRATDRAGNVSGLFTTSFILDTQPPTITVASPAAHAFTKSVMVTGLVTDNLSGVASLQGEVDGGSYGPVVFDAQGHFSFNTGLALDGSADGAHTAYLKATDNAGNLSSVFADPFTLDTTPPSITITSPAQGLLTNTNVTITGTVADTLSGVVSLSATVDGSSSVAVAYGSSGTFSFTTALPLDGTKDGPHTVNLTAQDKAGNTDTTPYSFTLDTIPPAQPVFALDPAFEASGNPLETTDAAVTLDGTTDPATSVVLVGTGLSTTSDGSGHFQFTGVSLQMGGNALAAQATDAAGNLSSYTQTITRITAGPVITAALSDDTAPGGTTNSDGITSDPSVAGTVTDSSPITAFSAGFDGVPITAFVSILADLQANGSFALSPAEIARINGGSALLDGAHTLNLVATDQAGNVSSTYGLSFTLDDQPPGLAVTSPANDSYTNKNVNVAGTVSDNLSGVVSLTAQLDGGTATAVSFDATTGAFSFPTTLDLTGGKSDGPHTIVLQATDVAGNVTPDTIHFTIKTTLPAQPTFALAAADRENGALLSTTNSQVTLTGQTDPNISLAILQTGAAAQSSNTGAFQFPGVGLALGDNALTVQAMDAAGNISQYQVTIHRDPATGGVNQVIYWNQVQLQAIVNDATTPEVASRGLAMVSAAVYDAVNAIDATPGYYVTLQAPAGASADAAVASAAYTVLSYLYPGQQSYLNTTFSTDAASIPDGQSKTDGESVGQSVANAIIAMRQNDGSTNYVDYTPGSAPGDWQPTAPMFMVAENPQWAALKPFAMTSDSQFRPGAPPALTSQDYATAVNKTLDLGASNSTTRTADETQIAKFWNDGAGTYTPPGHWNSIAEAVAQQQGESLAQAARLFAELNVAEADAAIVAWDAKYTYNTWRPIQLAGGAGTAVNSQIETIANWTPLINTPPFPEYISGHSTFSGAAAAILTSVFGANYSFTASSMGLPGVTRSYTSFAQTAAEAGESRIYGGIHFEFSNQAALTAGGNLGAYVLQTFSTSADKTPPTIAVTNPPTGSVTTSTNLTITGTVLDNLSGVASLQAQVDGGAFAPVSFNSQGHVSLTTTFATDGSADGVHTIGFEATDVAGNVTQVLDVSMTLDTRVPAIALTSPTTGAALTAATVLAGSADGTGSPITSLVYEFDSGLEIPIAFGSDGTFSQALNLSGLKLGNHTLTVTARDAAGNVTQDSATVNLASPPALTLSNVAPSDGAVDVGVTFRPKIDFSRPIDISTLTASDFYLTDSTGATIPTTIVPASDGSYAWLFPTNPMPGGSVITMVLDGSQIKASDGTLLDAASTGTAGSKLMETFTTVSTASVPGTGLSGVVADPGPDLKPGTRDDVQAGPDGVLMTGDDVYLLPIAGVSVSILGDPQDRTVTGADGSFSFSSVPTGDVKLVVDGRTATNPPSGYYFPEMVMDLSIQPGQANTVMGSMMTPQGEGANPLDRGVYLPRVATSILKSVSTTVPTTVGVNGTSAPDLTPQQQQELTLTVQPGSLVGASGQTMSTGQVGISTVPPQLVMDMLPTGVMQHTFDITIQAPGVTTFSTPATLTFPNVFNAAPGTKLDVLSFDHTTGRLVIDGTATVSADGLMATTDPGSGVTAPGWHGLTPPGSENDPPCYPSTPTIHIEPIPVLDGIQDYYFSTDTGSFRLAFGNAAKPIDPSQNPCSPVNDQATSLIVQITVDGFPTAFLDGLASQTFTLEPGQQQYREVSLKKLLVNLQNIPNDRLYGVTIHLDLNQA